MSSLSLIRMGDPSVTETTTIFSVVVCGTGAGCGGGATATGGGAVEVAGVTGADVPDGPEVLGADEAVVVVDLVVVCAATGAAFGFRITSITVAGTPALLSLMISVDDKLKFVLFAARI